ncbi:MAG: N-acetyltransferase family protein [Actinomycetota bacterium]|nr:N-acetyltransferase family protein [Actinomycetota bacterium]
MQPGDWDRVRAIYEQGIAAGDATFETEAPDQTGWDRSHLGRPRLVACVDAEVEGWAALSPVSTRCVYGGVGELSIYVAAEVRGAGVGRALMAGLIPASELEGIWTVEAGVFPENLASIALLEGSGFRVVGTREKLGRLRGRWRDVVLLERRSPNQFP